MNHKCGVVGLQMEQSEASDLAYYSLYALQHRGQESAGIVTYDGFQQHSKKAMGLVGEVFSKEDLESLKGNAAIGHVRYPTYGSVESESCHPFTVTSKRGSLALGHNGNLVNTEEIREELEELGHAFTSDSDTEVMVHEFAKNLLEHGLIEAAKRTMNRLKGAYSVTMMYNGTVVGIRDPYGIRPLCLGKVRDGYMLASESVALDVLDGELVRDVKPGEVVILRNDGVESYQLFEEKPAHCFFEYVYFSRPDSNMEDRYVYDARREMGKMLYENHGVDTDIVSPVPDSGRSFATGYAEAGGLEFVESLMKNRYVGRTFIMATQKARETAVRLKLNAIKSNIEGKTVTLIDDSIVRGTTSHQLVKILKEAGAEEVHMRIGSPPIIAPCFLGIDMATKDELIANGKEIEEVRERLDLDTLEYLTIEEVAEAVDLPIDHLCTGCVCNEYPVPIK